MADSLIGTNISGKYHLRAILGRGAMGEVYRATQLDVEGEPLREVALKMIRIESSLDPLFYRRFLQEVRVMAKLHSPHTVTVYDSGQTETGQPYFAMELVNGSTLRELLNREGTLSVQRAAAIAGQICDALAEAHGLPEPIVHRDLKPGNIFIAQQQGQD